MSDSEGTPAVVVVESAEQTNPEYVTDRELDARMELLRTELRQDIQRLESAAIDAAITADQAEAHAESAEAAAEVAVVVAVEAAEIAVEAAEDPAPDDETSTGPKAAEPHQEKPKSADAGDRPTSGYGARSIYG